MNDLMPALQLPEDGSEPMAEEEWPEDGGQQHLPGASLLGLREDLPDGPDGPGGGDGELLVGSAGDVWLRADAAERGMTWESYCRECGIVSENRRRSILRFEQPLGERSAVVRELIV